MSGVLRVLLAQVIIVMLIGGFVAICAHVFVTGIQYFEVFRTQRHHFFELFGIRVNLVTAGLLLAAYFVVIMVRKIGQMPKWESPADIIYSAQNRNHEIAPKKGFLTIFASFVSLAGGASLGQYGPLVHLGGVIGISVAKCYREVWLGRDVLIGCGVAAAIAAGFNAPIAAIIFAHEAVLRHFSARALTLISIASICSSALNRLLFEPLDIFIVTTEISVSAEIVGISLIAGIVFGISAIFIIRALFFVQGLSNRSPNVYRWTSGAALIYLLLLSQTLPQVLGLGMGLINELFSSVETTQMLLILLFAKVSAVILSLTIGFSGGFVGPALVVGALLGALLAQLAAMFGLSFLTTMLVVSGSAAVAGTVFGAPLAMVILVLELTHSYDLSVAAMLSVVVSTLIFHLFYGHSLFDLQLLARGIDLAKGRIFLELESTKLDALTSEDFLCFQPDTSADIILSKMQDVQQTEGYCLDENGQFLGKISIFDAVSGSNKTAISLAKQDCLKLYCNQSINEAMEVAIDFVGEGLPVLDPKSHKMVGVVSEAHLFNAYSAVTQKVREIETA